MSGQYALGYATVVLDIQGLCTHSEPTSKNARWRSLSIAKHRYANQLCFDIITPRKASCDSKLMLIEIMALRHTFLHREKWFKPRIVSLALLIISTPYGPRYVFEQQLKALKLLACYVSWWCYALILRFLAWSSSHLGVTIVSICLLWCKKSIEAKMQQFHQCLKCHYVTLRICSMKFILIALLKPTEDLIKPQFDTLQVDQIPIEVARTSRYWRKLAQHEANQHSSFTQRNKKHSDLVQSISI